MLPRRPALVFALTLTSVPPAAARATPIAAAAPHEAKARPSVVIAEVASRVDPRATHLDDVAALVRSDVTAALAGITLPGKRRYALSIAVVHLTTTRGERSISAACTVSAALRDAETGTLLFIVEGRARAEDSAAFIARAERDALAAAAGRAVAALPEGLRRM